MSQHQDLTAPAVPAKTCTSAAGGAIFPMFPSQPPPTPALRTSPRPPIRKRLARGDEKAGRHREANCELRHSDRMTLPLCRASLPSSYFLTFYAAEVATSRRTKWGNHD